MIPSVNELDLIARWNDARRTIVLAQLGPIFLLTSTIGLLQFGLADTSLLVRLAAAGILLATGVLGAVAQISAAGEAGAAARDLAASNPTSALGRRVSASGRWVGIVTVGTPTIFVTIFLALLVALLFPAN